MTPDDDWYTLGPTLKSNLSEKILSHPLPVIERPSTTSSEVTRNYRARVAQIASKFNIYKNAKMHQEDREWKRKMIQIKFKEKVKRCYYKFKEMGLSLQEVHFMQAVPTEQHQRADSALFFEFVKNNDVLAAELLLLRGRRDMALHKADFEKHVKENSDTNWIGNEERMDLFLVHQFDAIGYTPLHWAVKYDYADMCRLLLQYNARPNAGDFFNRTPLFIATKAGNNRVVRLLLKAKANPTIQSLNGQTCFGLC